MDPPGNIKRPIRYAVNLAFGTFLTSLLSISNFSTKLEYNFLIFIKKLTLKLNQLFFLQPQGLIKLKHLPDF